MRETIKIICIEDSMDRISTGGRLIKKFECFQLEHFEYNTSNDFDFSEVNTAWKSVSFDWKSTTSGLPFVIVPVLSKITASILFAVSKTSALFIKIPNGVAGKKVSISNAILPKFSG